MATTTRTFEIPTTRLPELRKRVEKLQKRAKRLGLAPVTFVVESAKTVVRHRQNGEGDIVLQAHKVTVSCEPVVASGWTFVANIHHADGVSIVMSSDAELCKKYEGCASDCQHCNTRRIRHKTWILRKTETGELMQVGHNCLASFLNTSTPDEFAASCQYQLDLQAAAEDEENKGWCSVGVQRGYDLQEYLSWVALAIRKHGWVSKREAWERNAPHDATANVAKKYLWTNKPVPGVDASQYMRYELADAIAATCAIEWARGLEPKDGEEYLNSLRAIATTGSIPENLMPFAASMIAAHDRARRAEERKQREARFTATSVHFGTVGKREEFVLTVERVVECESNFGTSYLHMFRTPDGSKAKWFSSSTRLDEGREVRVRATVKDHSEYKGVKETMLTRVQEVR